MNLINQTVQKSVWGVCNECTCVPYTSIPHTCKHVCVSYTQLYTYMNSINIKSKLCITTMTTSSPSHIVT